MLSFLRIENLAIIESLSVEFGPGLNVLTGETGAGKSIIVDAVGLLLGERGSADQIRTGAGKLAVEAVFEIDGRKRLLDRLEEMGLDAGPEGLVLRRDVNISGRSRAFVNGSLVTLQQLREIGEVLADLHGQHQHQSLLRAEAQREALDRFGGHGPLLEGVAAACGALEALRAERERLRAMERDRARREEDLRSTIEEIASVGPRAGEEIDLRREEGLLRNAEEVRALAEEILLLLNDDDAAVLPRMGTIRERLSRLAAIDDRSAEALRAVEEARLSLKEALRAVEPYREPADFEPGRLEAVATRLASLERIKRKHGPTIEEVLERGTLARAELEEMGGAAGRLSSLDAEIAAAARGYAGLASELSRKRVEAARAMERALAKELKALAMEGCRFAVAFETREEAASEVMIGGKRVAYGPAGVESVEILISPNPGEELRPLARVISGGELSRMMLALRTVSESRADARTLIFDEVDAGVGGTAADSVAIRLQGLSRGQQILCVTHLPQIAALADTHLSVGKSAEKGRTRVLVASLAGEERVEELARMIGSPEAPTARKHAAALIQSRKAT
jgi:DNA repair protein RecN (Recombination protein N)